ncbi:MAG: dihydrodipicolinate reductase [bacterium]
MPRKIKLVQMGLGPMGIKLCNLALKKQGIELVGVVELANVGSDAGEVLGLDKKIGIAISDDINAVLAAKPDIVMHSTVSQIEMARDQLVPIIKAGVNVVSTCEELSYPWFTRPDISQALDDLARENNVTILGTGVNPGFCMDTFPIVMTGVCQSVEHVAVSRIQDASSRRLPFQKKIGAGLTPTEFADLKATGKLRHVGLEESAGMIAKAMGWRIEEYSETIDPIIAKEAVSSDYLQVMPGQAVGVEQIAIAKMGGREIIRMVFQAYLGAPESHDTVTITGTPNVKATVPNGIHGDLATAAMAVNALPRVIKAPPGFTTMLDLPPVHPYAGDWGGSNLEWSTSFPSGLNN